MRWRCAHLPWHKLVKFWPLSAQSELYECSCGKRYAVNHDARQIMRWEDAEHFYRERFGVFIDGTVVR